MKINNQLIRTFNPCYDPSEVVKDENESLEPIEWVEKYRCKLPDKDIVWLLCRNEFLSDKSLRLFAVWCAREVLKLVKNPDTRSIEACCVAERYANGEATEVELAAARDAAMDAASSAAESAAAWAAVMNAASAATYAAAHATAYAAARAAARAAADDSAARAADDAADKAHTAQVDKLLEILQEEQKIIDADIKHEENHKCSHEFINKFGVYEC